MSSKTLLYCVFVMMVVMTTTSALRAPMFDNVEYVSGEPLIYQQKLDHFSMRDSRYWVYNDHFHNKSAPIVLYICGEAECRGIKKDWLVNGVAPGVGGAIYALEHRYYGASQPFKELTTKNLKYLSALQALEDLQSFTMYIDAQLHGNVAAYPRNPWITIGGSYAGALSAWYRKAHPRFSVGALSSSGVVHPMIQFPDYDRQIVLSAGSECYNVLRIINNKIDERVNSSPENQKAMFELFNLTMKSSIFDFNYLIADGFAGPLQYGTPDAICVPMVKAYKDGVDLIQAFAKFMNDYIYPRFGIADGYSTEFQRRTVVPPGDAVRQWTYQTCREFGWYQVCGNASECLRSPRMDMDAFNQHCNDVYDEKMYPAADFYNKKFGSFDIVHKSTNIFFTNGSQDPWYVHGDDDDVIIRKWVCVRASDVDNMPARIITASNAGHCVDLSGCTGGCTGDGEQQLAAVRAEIIANMNRWISKFNVK